MKNIAFYQMLLILVVQKLTFKFYSHGKSYS